MSFGLRDQDWVDPPEEPPVICRDCRNWTECPCGCGLVQGIQRAHARNGRLRMILKPWQFAGAFSFSCLRVVVVVL